MTDTGSKQRIAPLEPPYAPDTEAQLRKWMPPNSAAEPLALFRTLMVHRELAGRMRPLGAGILGHGLIEPREREIVILRTCARCGAEYEWGVHAVAFGQTVGLTSEQIAATALPTATDDGLWSDRELLLVRLADELYETNELSDPLWEDLTSTWKPPELLELIVIAGWYRTLAYVLNSARVEHEPWAARFPSA